MNRENWDETYDIIRRAREYEEPGVNYVTDPEGNRMARQAVPDGHNVDLGRHFGYTLKSPDNSTEYLSRIFGVTGEWERIIRRNRVISLAIENQSKPSGTMPYVSFMNLEKYTGHLTIDLAYGPARRKEATITLITETEKGQNVVMTSDKLRNPEIRQALLRLIRRAYPKSYPFGDGLNGINVITGTPDAMPRRVAESHIKSIVEGKVRLLLERRGR